MAPGPDMLLVLGRALGQGRFAAALAAPGCAAGVGVLSLAVPFGLTAVLQSSQIAFPAMKFAGASQDRNVRATSLKA
jgi:threonine/homoserine/homoserine lactone efflux protein